MELGKIKLSLRITTDAFNEELTMLAAAAYQDLLVAGVSPEILKKEPRP